MFSGPGGKVDLVTVDLSKCFQCLRVTSLTRPGVCGLGQKLCGEDGKVEVSDLKSVVF